MKKSNLVCPNCGAGLQPKGKPFTDIDLRKEN
jgi:hypothetical protein